MKNLISIIKFTLWILYLWFIFLPSKLMWFGTVINYFLFTHIRGDQATYLFNRQLEEQGGIIYHIFWIGIGFPLFWSFICGMTEVKGVNSSLENALKFRNGQMDISTPQKAFSIFRKTALLDLMNDESQNSLDAKVRQGFNAEYGAKPPTDVFKDLMKSEDK